MVLPPRNLPFVTFLNGMIPYKTKYQVDYFFSREFQSSQIGDYYLNGLGLLELPRGYPFWMIYPPKKCLSQNIVSVNFHPGQPTTNAVVRPWNVQPTRSASSVHCELGSSTVAPTPSTSALDNYLEADGFETTDFRGRVESIPCLFSPKKNRKISMGFLISSNPDFLDWEKSVFFPLWTW